jgi:hypothetical protein
MRAREFIKENTEPNGMHSSAVPNGRALDIDKYYELYRLSLDMASAGREKQVRGDKKGDPAGDGILLTAYSDGEEAIIKQALKHRGIKDRSVSAGPSTESDNTNISSPVAKPKKNRYGV